jgi:hypothetical protein
MKRIVRKSEKAIPQCWLADAERSFVELWRMIEEGQLPYTKAEVCRFIGCSLRWAEQIVAGAARHSP